MPGGIRRPDETTRVRAASRRALTGIVALAAAAAPSGAQVRVIDEGTFSIYSAGERIGREDFSIRRLPGASGGSYLAQGNVLIGQTRMTVALNADSTGHPQRYSFESIVEGRVVESATGESRRGIWLGRAQRDGGESAREFRLSPGTVAAEPGVVHQLWFLLRRVGGEMPGLLFPRTLTVTGVVVEDAGPDTVTLGLRDIVTRRWVIRSAGNAYLTREAWTDLEGRLLRVRVPDLDLEALRDEPPGETPGE